MTGILLDRYRFGPPAASNWTTFVDAGLGANPTLTDAATRGLVMDFGAGSISNNTDYVKAVTKNKPAGTDYDIIARIHLPGIFNFSLGGLCVSDGTKIVTYGFATNGSGGLGAKVSRWNTSTSFSADSLTTYPISPHCEWMKLSVVSSDPKDFYVSTNGVDWVKVMSTTQTGFLTYSKIGLAQVVNRNAASSFPIALSNQFTMAVMYYKDPDINPGF